MLLGVWGLGVWGLKFQRLGFHGVVGLGFW